jgi:hypothetical protein
MIRICLVLEFFLLDNPDGKKELSGLAEGDEEVRW